MSAFAVITQICCLYPWLSSCISKSKCLLPILKNLYMRKYCRKPSSSNLLSHRAGKWGPELCPRPQASLGSTLGFLPPAQFHFHHTSWLPRQEPVPPMKPVLLSVDWEVGFPECKSTLWLSFPTYSVQLSESEHFLFWLQPPSWIKRSRKVRTEVLARRGSLFQCDNIIISITFLSLHLSRANCAFFQTPINL